MFKLFNSRGINNDFSKFAEAIRTSFLQVQKEFRDHLDAINDNSREIQENYEQICEIENKIEKLNEKIDEISLYMKRSSTNYFGNNYQQEGNQGMELTSREKEIFLFLYDTEDTKPLYYSDISYRLGISEHLAREYVLSMITKGIPINKVVKNSKVLLYLDANFKQAQSRESIFKLNESLNKWVNAELILAD